ncbi:MAG: cation transporter [Planctomycetaceae bacterium]|nr:cation transporter [Planctomycetaceae bacterium]
MEHHPPEIHVESHAPPKSARKLAIVATLTGLFMLVELIGGYYANSLALLSDAGHMFVDLSGLVLAATAAALAQRPADRKRTFGYRRAEVLGAFFNGTLLCGLVLFVLWESMNRLFTPEPVDGWLMLWIAAGGLLFNIIAGIVLLRGADRERDINLRGALVNVIGDALGSVGALAGALLVIFLGWNWADPAIGLLIAILIAFNAVRLLRETLAILLQSVPPRIDLNDVLKAVSGVDGVASVHDIHVWAMAPGDETLTLHVVLKDKNAMLRWDAILIDINRVLNERFKLYHNIIQPELDAGKHPEIKHL